MENKNVLLEYIGTQQAPGWKPIRLYNVFGYDQNIHPDGSTISEDTARRLGIPLP